MIKLRIEGLPKEVEKAVQKLTDFEILSESKIYPNRNSQYVRKYIEAEIRNEMVIDETVIVIDTETTGIDPGQDELLQVSIIDTNGNTLYNQYLKPVKATSWEDAERVNHISPEMVKDCPTILAEMPKINEILNKANIIIGYNTAFDLSFLAAAGAEWNAMEIDVMLDFAPIYGEWNEYYGDYKWQTLTTCTEYYNYDWSTDNAHNSLADCRATLFCYKAMQTEYFL